MLTSRFGRVSAFEAKQVLQDAFPGTQCERSTFVFGIRPTPSLCSSVPQSTASDTCPHTCVECKKIEAENLCLRQRISQLEQEVDTLTSAKYSTFEQQADKLLSNSCVSHGPDTLEHLDTFTIHSILADVEREAPDLLRFFQSVGSIDQGDGTLGVEAMKTIMSLCILLNARNKRAKGLQLLISIMLIARATSKQVNDTCMHIVL